MTALIDRLRSELRHTRESERRMVDLGLPEQAREALALQDLSRLQAAAVLVPIVARLPEPTLLLTQRSDRLRRHAGQIAFPGGRADPDDRGPRDTALRETEEEIGVARGQVEVIGYLDDYPTVTGFRVTPVVGLLSPDAHYAPDGQEVVEVFEVPLQFVLDKANYQREVSKRDGMEVPYHAVPFGERYIWGATAAMLKHLQERLEGHAG